MKINIENYTIYENKSELILELAAEQNKKKTKKSRR